MKQRLILLVFSVFLSIIVFGQSQEKYTMMKIEKFGGKSDADYYRLITFDEKGKPLGKVKDYYITGELQWEGYFSYVDKYDNSKRY